ncbi:glycosyltransferase [Bacillus sp. 1P06AnD]|uniref:glycosyltransferase n=1 Tax=Bacillus sp. 1P06AnD TaxID=3132208 RepID=UPI0039A3E015
MQKAPPQEKMTSKKGVAIEVNRPTISLCMIVKNEECRLGRCLQSAVTKVDEIIVVDTGSSDETVNIAKAFGAIVIHHEWKHDFADARNRGLQSATKEYILWLDADEELKGDEKPFDYILNPAEPGPDILAVQVRNYYGQDEPIDEEKAFLAYQYRLIKNNGKIRFFQPIHERLTINETTVIAYSNKESMYIDHFGYLDSIVKEKAKSERNIQLLVKQLEENEQNHWALFHLANELSGLNQFRLAFNFVNKAIICCLDNLIMPPALFYRLKYGILVETASFEGAFPAIDRAIALYDDYVDLLYYKGLILFHMKKFAESKQVFERCLHLGDDHPAYLVTKGAGSYLAEQQLEVLEKMGFC